MRQLFVRPTELRFGPKDERKLVRTLETRFKNLVIEEVDSPSILRLDAEGQLAGGYRYSAVAFVRLCGALGVGLYKVLSDVAGLKRTADVPLEDCSILEAIRFFNRMVDLRFATRIEGKLSVMRDVREKTIDGFVTPTYALLDNCDFLERVQETSSSSASSYRFDSALVRGRYLAVNYKGLRPLFSQPFPDSAAFADKAGDQFYAGIRFVNSEMIGESSVWCAPIVQRQLDNTYALGPQFGRGGNVHVGQHFKRELGAVLADAADFKPDASAMRAGMKSLLATSVRLVVSSDRTANKEIKRRLMDHGLEAEQAIFVIRDAIYRGAYGKDEWAPVPTSGATVSRTAFDIYGALTTLAQDLGPGNQERLARVAYKLLHGKVRL